VAALDGMLAVDSPPGAGTRLRARLRLPPPESGQPVASGDAAQV
jgi:hypothetical protein